MKQIVDFVENIIENIVIVKPFEFCNKKENIIEDARSAAFYALGMALRKKETVVLFVPGEYITNVYTAITEAWFQKANIIVVSIFDKTSEVKTSWMDRCVIESLTASIDEKDLISDFIRENIGVKGPVLLNLIDNNVNYLNKDYSDLLNYLAEHKVITYNALFGEKSENIQRKYKYGVISKYIGMSTVENCGILICTCDCVLVDTNVFRTRYANSNMKIIILDDGRLYSNNFDKWLSSNNWDCKITDNYADVSWLLKNDKPSVLMIKEN